ncbi:MAG: APC family permease, partial [Nanoarchaeota archaeon]
MPEPMQESEQEQKPEFKQAFGYWAVLSLAIGSIAGTTMFLGAGIGARYSGNLLLVAWAILSVIAVYIAACFGELASSFPKSGGTYEYAKQAYGKFLSFVLAWAAWLLGSIGVVLMIVGATGALLPGLTDFQQFLLSVGIIVTMNGIAYLGVEASSMMLIGFAIIMVTVPIVVMVKGLPAVVWQNFTPFFTHPISTVMVTSFFIVENYFGWEGATYLAEETRNATKTIPKALLHATALIALLGFLLTMTLMGIIPWQQLSTKAAPLTDVASMLFSEKVRLAIGAGVFLALLGSAASGVVSLPRLILAIARDKLFPGQFKMLHTKFNTPSNAILFQTVALVILLLLGFANYETLLGMMIPIGTLMYTAILIA